MTIHQPGDGEGQSPGSTADQDITFKGKTPIRQRHRAGVRDRQLCGQTTIPEITVQEHSERRITSAGNRRGHHGEAVRLDSRHTHQVLTIPERGSMPRSVDWRRIQQHTETKGPEPTGKALPSLFPRAEQSRPCELPERSENEPRQTRDMAKIRTDGKPENAGGWT